MISFYPGPSAIWEETADWMKEAVASGILSVNHRSTEFSTMLDTTIRSIRKTLKVPTDYEIFFTSSATEAWEMVLQNLPIKASAHYFNGAFGEKWYEYGKYLAPKAEAFVFEPNEIPTVHFTSADLICLTHTETSNASRLPEGFLQELRAHSKGQLIAVDATSSMGGIDLDWLSADVWFASVQKCLGLPAGLCLVVTSPAAAERTLGLRKSKHYNNLAFALENARNRQTTHTPNVLGIFLCGKAMQRMENIELVATGIRDRSKIWYDFFSSKGWEELIQEQSCKSETVMAVTGNKEWVAEIKARCKEAGFNLGNGYGKWKESSFRIANFPALKMSDHQKLIEFLGQ